MRLGKAFGRKTKKSAGMKSVDVITPAKTRPKADQPSSWLSQARKGKFLSVSPPLGALCGFARDMVLPIISPIQNFKYFW
jgi:hypothetical protein